MGVRGVVLWAREGADGDKIGAGGRLGHIDGDGEANLDNKGSQRSKLVLGVVLVGHSDDD